MSSFNDARMILKGMRKVLESHNNYKINSCKNWWNNSSIKQFFDSTTDNIETSLSDSCSKISKKFDDLTTHKNCSSSKTPLSSQTSPHSTYPSDFPSSSSHPLSFSSSDSLLSPESPLVTTKKSFTFVSNNKILLNKIKNKNIDKLYSTNNKNEDKSKKKSNKPVADKFESPDITKFSRESRVPGSRVGRLVSFGGLGAGLALGTVSEMAKRSLGLNKNNKNGAILDKNPFLTESNAERIVGTLCRVRGAALKLGQMLSIQDNSLISPQLQKIFERVRQSADFMPISQMEEVLKEDLGQNWRENFKYFEEKPFAAASIGQVHKGETRDGRVVAVKIQYPGVSNSINSDINNLMSLLKVSKVLPEGLYANTALKVARKELSWECDYIRESKASQKFRLLLGEDERFYIPEVLVPLTTKRVLTTELIRGVSLDTLDGKKQELRNKICKCLLELCLKEVFVFQFMQTDPNWSNFLYDDVTDTISLIDFGASRGFSRKFTSPYIELIMSAAQGDRGGVLQKSREMKFLTGFESKVMEKAHIDAVMILGEAFSTKEPFDFGKQSTAARIHQLIPVMLRHRLTPPPEETYSLHRKLAGCFLLCSKLNGKMSCRDLFFDIYNQFKNCHDNQNKDGGEFLIN